jgi:deazaflavin-dependent oxidoreductase (nitroreductase family)
MRVCCNGRCGGPPPRARSRGSTHGSSSRIASNFGRRHNPGWYHNLRADPRAWAEVEGSGGAYRAHELSGAERDRGFRLGAEIYPGFDHYVRWAGRRIPVLRLEPAS